MPASDRQPNRPVTEAATLSERAAMLVEQDILAGHLAPGSRLGIVDLVQRYEIGATPLREGLSRLMSRGLIVGIGQRGFRVADVSREDLLDITTMRTAVEVEAIRLAIVHGDDAWEAGIVSALHQMRRHIERTGDEFREGAEDFDRLHKGFHTALLAGLRLKTHAGGPFRSLRPGLSLSPRDDALDRQRQEVRARASIARRPRHRARHSGLAGDAGSASALDASTSSILQAARADTMASAAKRLEAVSGAASAADRIRRGHARSSAARPSSRISASASGPANSSASSAPPVAARPRRCGWRPGSTSRPAAR